MTPPPGTPPTSDDMFGSEYDRSEREFFAAHGMDADGDASPDGADRQWPAPQPLGGELPPVAPMVEAMLPAALRPLCLDVGERMQVPLDYPAAASVVCLAGAVGRRATIQPKAHDSGWIVVPNLWGALIGPPGVMKSPLLRAVAAPLHCIAEQWRIEHQSALADYADAAEEAALRKRAWEQRAVAAAKKDEPMPIRPDDSAAPPAERRLMLADATMEALHQVLAANPAGVLVLRDELTGWLAMMERAGREGERAFYLSAWAGDMAHTIDRIGRGSIHVPHCCVSMLGGIQPARLRSYLADTLSGGPGDDGLMQRFQLAVWPDLDPEWRDVDRPPDARALAAAEAMYKRLVQGDPEHPKRFRFGADAQELFTAWRGELEGRVRGDDMHPALVAHLAKYRSLMPSLALLFALADGGEDTVGLGHAQQAAAWCAYLETHGRRIYSCIVSPALRAAAELGRRIAGGWRAAEGSFALRDVYIGDWSGMDTPERAREAVEVLEGADWVRRIPADPGPRGGRPTELYAINPRAQRPK